MDQISRAEELEQKRSYWKQHIESWQVTGLTQAEYCRRHNLKHHQLVYWKKRFSHTEMGVSFVPLKLDKTKMTVKDRIENSKVDAVNAMKKASNFD